MKVIGQSYGYLMVAVLLLAVPAAARAQFTASAPVVSVLTVKVKGDQDAYLAKTKPFSAALKRNGATSVRVFRAAIAGEQAGLLNFVSEYPNLEAYAKSATKNSSDPELQKLRKEIEASGMREIVSTSLLVEVTPPADAPK